MVWLFKLNEMSIVWLAIIYQIFQIVAISLYFRWLFFTFLNFLGFLFSLASIFYLEIKWCFLVYDLYLYWFFLRRLNFITFQVFRNIFILRIKNCSLSLWLVYKWVLLWIFILWISILKGRSRPLNGCLWSE